MNCLFSPADILIPSNISIEKWSVIACDQFSSQPDYWERVENLTRGVPSTYHMIIPEAYLAGIDEDAHIQKIRGVMEDYLSGNVFREVSNCFIYVERTQPDGRTRKGIVGTIDLEEYDFTGNDAQIRASEGTVLDRLPARVKIRKSALIELPHIITFIDDKYDTVIKSAADKADSFETVYDFDLMEGGGHIRGKRVSGSDAQSLSEAMQRLFDSSNASCKVKMPAMVIGDGNHSLAGAKVYWDELKQGLSNHDRNTHPARKALVEVCNVYDTAIDFEAIHRVLFNVDVSVFIREFTGAVEQGADYMLQWVSGNDSGEIGIKAGCIGDMLVMVQDFIDEYINSNHNISIDYVHGKDSLNELAKCERALGLILPAMDKSELFKTVAARGVFPRKSFSVGHANDKRYYLECRRIV